jgi:hypothetical protein
MKAFLVPQPLGLAGSGIALLDGRLWAYNADRVLTVDLWVDGDCRYRVRATLDSNDAG